MEQLLIALLGAGAQEIALIAKGGVKEGATLSADFLSAINAVLAEHSKNSGIPIDQVIAEL